MSKQIRLPTNDDGFQLVNAEPEEKTGTPTNQGVTPMPPPSKITVTPVRLNARTHAMLHGARGMKTVVAPLSYYQKGAGAANTAFSFGYDLRPNLDSSWASWQGVFDEFKVLSAELHWNVVFTVAPTAAAAQTPNAAVAYDPTASISITAVNQVMDYEKFQILNVAAAGTGFYTTAPQAQSKGGHLVFHTSIPRGIQTSNTETLISTGQWRPTEDAVNYSWGQFSGYVAQGGATAVLQVEGFVRMMVQFRVRR